MRDSSQVQRSDRQWCRSVGDVMPCHLIRKCVGTDTSTVGGRDGHDLTSATGLSKIGQATRGS